MTPSGAFQRFEFTPVVVVVAVVAATITTTTVATPFAYEWDLRFNFGRS